jgi:hypothetical protein
MFAFRRQNYGLFLFGLVLNKGFLGNLSTIARMERKESSMGVAGMLKAWGPILRSMTEDMALQQRAREANAWFTSAFQQMAMDAMVPWFEGSVMEVLIARYPSAKSDRRIGLILAGNLPMVGLHDLLMVLLAGHRAVVKPSSKDRVLLEHLIELSPLGLRERVQVVERVEEDQIDGLIATGSTATAQQVAAHYAGVPKILRQSRFSVGLIDGGESEMDLVGLADDILRYHGLGCRSVSVLLVPDGYALDGLQKALEGFPAASLANEWSQVVLYESAMCKMLGVSLGDCKQVSIQRADTLESGRFGCLRIVRYRREEEVVELIHGASDHLQAVVAARHFNFRKPLGMPLVAMGAAQRPELHDFSDGIDTLEWLTGF